MAKLKCFILFLYAAVFSATAMADDNVRDGRPCLSGICVGDEVSTLSGIKWQPASFMGKPIISLKMSDAKENLKSQLEKFAPNSAAAVTAAAPYLRFNSFDSQAIPKLAKITGFCRRELVGMVGTFISDSGHQTTVYINVVPGVEPSSQSLRVTQIERTFPREYTSEQMSALSKQLEERYREVKKARPFASVTEPTWQFVGYERKLTLYAPIGDNVHIRDQLMKYPGCGKSLKID